ncbi:MAG: hypothetical protein M0C28_10665 [Candidatus Moduliflexus flocculans]|nr:hypothetical protein [Candidatus Moduliflexus flocculans]
MIQLNGLQLTLDEKEECLAAKAADALGIPVAGIVSWFMIKKALDARRNKPPHFVYAVKISLADTVVLPETLPEGIQIKMFNDEPAIGPSLTGSSRALSGKLPVVVIGSGPAGLFAAYMLAVREYPFYCWREGDPLINALRMCETFWEKGLLKPESNVLFGEGGAGTFSDGKLTSRTKNPYAGWVKKVLVEMGAPQTILTDAKPHIGTDGLREVIIHLRKKLIELGCIFQFESQVTDFIIRQDAIAAVIVNGQLEIEADKVILAIGQSADDTYHKLDERGVKDGG